MPPEPKPRRRRADMSVKQAVITLVMAVPLSGTAVWKTGVWLYEAQHIINEVPKLKQQLEAADQRIVVLEGQVARLSRWQCVLGWDPGGVLGPASILARNVRGGCR